LVVSGHKIPEKINKSYQKLLAAEGGNQIPPEHFSELPRTTKNYQEHFSELPESQRTLLRFLENIYKNYQNPREHFLELPRTTKNTSQNYQRRY
jgi:hypothetical protein